jgi:hypothetical protein
VWASPGDLGPMAAPSWMNAMELLVDTMVEQQRGTAKGSAALSLCTPAQPLYTRFANIVLCTNIFGVCISGAAVRPNPRHR